MTWETRTYRSERGRNNAIRALTCAGRRYKILENRTLEVLDEVTGPIETFLDGNWHRQYKSPTCRKRAISMNKERTPLLCNSHENCLVFNTPIAELRKPKPDVDLSSLTICELSDGDEVQVISGPMRGLHGTLIHTSHDVSRIFVVLRSKPISIDVKFEEIRLKKTEVSL